MRVVGAGSRKSCSREPRPLATTGRTYQVATRVTTSLTSVRTEADRVVATSGRLIRSSAIHAIRLDERLGDRLADPPLGTRLVPTAEPVMSLRILHAPRKERECGQGMIEGDALDIGGHPIGL
jgi:hypothetical protein